MPGRVTAPLSWMSVVPGASEAPMAAYALEPLATIQGTAASVSTLLTTVGSPHRPFCGGVRRPLVGLGAPVLERPQQDGLLAQHERARECPDLDAQLRAGAHRVGARGSPWTRPRRWRPGSRSTAVV